MKQKGKSVLGRERRKEATRLFDEIRYGAQEVEVELVVRGDDNCHWMFNYRKRRLIDWWPGPAKWKSTLLRKVGTINEPRMIIDVLYNVLDEWRAGDAETAGVRAEPKKPRLNGLCACCKESCPECVSTSLQDRDWAARERNVNHFFGG